MEQQNNADRVEREEMASEYANNALLEPSVWDIKIYFGQWYQSKNGEVDWHTAVTMPWAQAKLLAHYLSVNIAVYEKMHGKVKVPASLLPKTVESHAESLGAPLPTSDDPLQSAITELIGSMTKEFIEKES
jgi:hypothetical protein